MVTEKKCSKCKITKLSQDFHKNSYRDDGLQIYCKECAKGYIRLLICEECQERFPISHRNIKNRKKLLCKLCHVKAQTARIIAQNKKNAKCFTINKKGYTFNLLDGSYILSHRQVMEEHLGRKLTETEIVHHIDGNRNNNNLNNLFLTNTKGHSLAHRSLELIGYWLVQNNFINFDLGTGTYTLTDIEKSKGAQSL